MRVRVIGIDTPEVGECGFDQASAYMQQLALGRSVTLTPDPTQDDFDAYGRSLYYLDRDDGADIGEEMVRAGWAAVYVYEYEFERLDRYRTAADDAEGFERGVWVECDGRFHRSPGDEARTEAERKERSAVAFLRRYYRRLSNRQFATAWGMLAPRVRREFGRFSSWKKGYRRSLGSLVLATSSRLSGGRAVVGVRFRSRDRDACGRVVRQQFRATWTLAPRDRSWVAVRVKARKVSGGTVRFDRSQCGRRSTPSPPSRPSPPTNCQGYSPCIRPGPDVDCAGGDGDGPRYTGPVRVTGSDPYDLDGDGDGFACE